MPGYHSQVLIIILTQPGYCSQGMTKILPGYDLCQDMPATGEVAYQVEPG
jgi:hypothetical protein